MKAGFTSKKRRPELYSGGLQAWHTCIPISAAQLFESRQVISLGDKYYFSVGAHHRKNYFLLGSNDNEPLTVEKSIAASSLLTFVINSPVVPDFTVFSRGKVKYSFDETSQVKKLKKTKLNRWAPPNFGRFERAIAGTGLRSNEYFNAFVTIAETLDPLTDVGTPNLANERKIPSGRFDTDPYISWPSSDRAWRALAAYWSAILSLVVPARILNFWRAIEAVTTKTERYVIFENLPCSRIRPVWTRSLTIRPPGHRDYWRTRNDSALLKRRALNRRKDLISRFGNAHSALDWLYIDSRGKAAHADKSSLDFDRLSSFDDQIRDAQLFQYMARVAIERAWS